MQWSVVAWSFLLLAGAVGSDDSIIQTPKRITVTEGGTVRLNCTFVGNTNSRLVGISWYKDEKTREVCNKSGDYYGRVLTYSTTGITKQSIDITDLNVNDTGKYYCQVSGISVGTHHGHGTDVTVVRSTTGSQSTNFPLIFGLLGAALLGAGLILIIYLRCRSRSPGKGTGTEDGAQENGTSKNIIYADLNIKKPNRREGENGARPLPAADPVIYSALRYPAPLDTPASSIQKKNPRKKEQVVYATMNAQRSPVHHR